MLSKIIVLCCFFYSGPCYKKDLFLTPGTLDILSTMYSGKSWSGERICPEKWFGFGESKSFQSEKFDSNLRLMDHSPGICKEFQLKAI